MAAPYSGKETNDLLDFEKPKSGSSLDAEKATNLKWAAPRLKSAAAAVALYVTCCRDDEVLAERRSKVDGMYNGEAPFSDSKLRAMGQGGRCNVNWGDAQRQHDASQTGYVDLVHSVDTLVNVTLERGTQPEDADLSEEEATAVINEEITSAIREWPEFESRFLTLSSQFIKHGVGVSYFVDPFDWKFQVAGLSDFKVPRNTRVCEDAADIAFVRRDYTVEELAATIRNEEVAKSEGWDVGAVKMAILNAHRGDKSDRALDWEHWTKLYHEGNTFATVGVKSVRLVHTWVKEIDGTVSVYLWEEPHSKQEKGNSVAQVDAKPDKQEFLYKRERAHKSAQEAYAIFTEGVGNGFIHGVRGQGVKIFPTVQYLNRLRCQLADAASLAGGVMVQPQSYEDLRDVAIQTMGPYNVLRPNVEIVERKGTPDLTKNVIPALNDLTRNLNEAADFYSPEGAAAQGSPYRNQLHVRADLERSARLSQSSLTLFYASFDRLMRELTKRLVNGSKSDPIVSELIRRCAERGVDLKTLRSIDHRKTKATRAIGAGNPSARIATLDELDRERGYFDEVGNRNLTYDRVSTRIGHDAARRYITKTPQPRGTTDQSLATLENAMLMQGTGVPTLPAQLHGTHLDIHLPQLQQLIEAAAGGGDLQQLMPALGAAHQHVAEHAQALGADPTQQDKVAMSIDFSNKARQILENAQRQAEADAARAPEGGEQTSKVAELELIAQTKARIMEQHAEVEMGIKERKAQQEQALKDFEAAAKAQREEGSV
jgi:hypothetical protein